MKTLLCLLAAPLVLCAADPQHTKDSLDTVKKRLKEKKAVLVDVRERSEWDAGHVKGAVLVPLSKLRSGDARELLRSLPKDKIVYTHCRSGGRALRAAEMLKKLGYDVRPLEPGYKALIEAGFPRGEK